MSRGRHRQTPPLHRLLSPVSIAVAALAGAAGAWLVEGDVTDTGSLLLRGLATCAAAAALAGAVLLRRWDRDAGRTVGELRAARARDSGKAEERAAELETERDQARELRAAVETRLREKRAELARLRTEHAALLRRYATAETERASALERRRVLAIEAAEPTKALPATVTDHRSSSGAPTTLTYRQAEEALERLSRNAARQREARELQAQVEEARRLEARAKLDHAARARATRAREESARIERERAERNRPEFQRRTGSGQDGLPDPSEGGAGPRSGAGRSTPAAGPAPRTGFDFFGSQQAAPGPAGRRSPAAEQDGDARGGPGRQHGEGRGPSGRARPEAGSASAERTTSGAPPGSAPAPDAPVRAVPRPAAGKVIDLGTHSVPDEEAPAASAAEGATEEKRTPRRGTSTGRRRGPDEGREPRATRRTAAPRRAIS